jgi:hypothetical protein
MSIFDDTSNALSTLGSGVGQVGGVVGQTSNYILGDMNGHENFRSDMIFAAKYKVLPATLGLVGGMFLGERQADKVVKDTTGHSTVRKLAASRNVKYKPYWLV